MYRPAMPSISVVFDLPAAGAGFRFTVEGVRHAVDGRRAELAVDVIRTAELAAGRAVGDGILLGPGSPYDEPRAVEDLATRARREGIPLVGT